ncbi:Csta [Acrasis kona]|uniref:Csta n=1 Tax=Acrasis kona TaxID=1008807 RepID=A0AAW2YJ05_9EUKA
MVMGGATKESKPADSTCNEVCDLVRSEVEKRTNKNFEVFEPVEYKTQVVAGTNFFVKVHVGNGEHIHLRIYRDLSRNVQLSNLEENKTKDQEIQYF